MRFEIRKVEEPQTQSNIDSNARALSRGLMSPTIDQKDESMRKQMNVVIAEKDAQKLRSLIEDSAHLENREDVQWQLLEEEIERAKIVPRENLPKDVVTMHSRVRIVDMRTGEQLVYQIVFPHEANYAEKRISILAPIGMALLGYAAGTEIEWKVPSGSRRLRVEAVEQPVEIKRERAVA